MSGLADLLVHALGWLPGWFVVLLISVIPFVELRGSLPVGYLVYHMPILETTVLSIIGNMLPIPFILWYFPRIEAYFRRWAWWDRNLDKLFSRTRRRARASISRYGPPFLLVFVAIPIPTTGAWTGALIAYLFDLERKRSFVAILLGVLVAGGIIAYLVLGATAGAWLATIALIVILGIIIFVAGRYESRAKAAEDDGKGGE